MSFIWQDGIHIGIKVVSETFQKGVKKEAEQRVDCVRKSSDVELCSTFGRHPWLHSFITPHLNYVRLEGNPRQGRVLTELSISPLKHWQLVIDN